MAVSTDVIGRALPVSTVDVERGRLAFFATAIGETDPVYSDLAAARAAGHPDLPVPPTFLFGLEMAGADPFALFTELGIDLRRVLHGEQSFTYHAVAHAGETLTVAPCIADVYSKKGGALEFIVKETSISRSDGTVVAELRNTIVIQNPAQNTEVPR
ncbi:MaoC family dehydratase N-terminal domain-containing protein [Pseudonocardia sp. GCM10023141]|uniref:MaoC family dehydratase N-terminal domain-containing protein n=1 Tax=Pseudonocardia sp. GCM10023141 TaxID=3252653 RepID=UPI00361426A8